MIGDAVGTEDALLWMIGALVVTAVWILVSCALKKGPKS